MNGVKASPASARTFLAEWSPRKQSEQDTRKHIKNEYKVFLAVHLQCETAVDWQMACIWLCDSLNPTWRLWLHAQSFPGEKVCNELHQVVCMCLFGVIVIGAINDYQLTLGYPLSKAVCIFHRDGCIMAAMHGQNLDVRWYSTANFCHINCHSIIQVLQIGNLQAKSW